jgi:hypothetical protein
MWFIFQAAIVLAIVQSNIWWKWADAGIQVGIVGMGLAYLGTLIVQGYLDKWAARKRRRSPGSPQGF